MTDSMFDKEKMEEETTATEVIQMAAREAKAKDWGMIFLTILFSVSFICMSLLLYAQILSNERSNQRWMEYLSQYDFISQDGEGYNYFNSEVGGNVVNGTEGAEE